MSEISSFEISTAHARDANQLIALEARTFGDKAWPGKAIGGSFSQIFVEVLFAHMTHRIDTRNPAGFLVWRKIVDEAEILSIGVDPDWQKRGIAKGLLKELESRARKQALRRIFLEVRVDNTAALALYRGCGYHPIGTRRHYYRDGVDGVSMAFAL